MVRLEDIGYERSVTDRVSCFAVPVEVSVSAAGGEPDVVTYSFTKEAADGYHARFATCPYSGEAMEFLRKELAPLMETRGYSPVYEPLKFRKEFVWNRDRAPGGTVLADCRIIDSLRGLSFDDELPVEEYDLFPDIPTDRMAVIERDGKVVCFAGVNDLSEDGACEINVECAPGYRRNGYAASCAAKLAEYLAGTGENVVYVCSDSNTASERTALRAGFEYAKTVMSYVCMKRSCENGLEDSHGI